MTKLRQPYDPVLRPYRIVVYSLFFGFVVLFAACTAYSVISHFV